jgi:hypothetical protein
MKKLILFAPVLLISALLALSGCTALRPSKTPDPVDPGLSFNVNGVAIEVDGRNPELLTPKRISYYGNPIRIEGIHQDENASVSYMLMDGSIYDQPVSVSLNLPFTGAPLQATVRVIVTTEDGKEEDCFLVIESADLNVLEMTVLY